MEKETRNMVVSNPGAEHRYSINQFCKLFPGRKGQGISRATAMRWVLRGVGGVQLKSVKIGGARYVSREAVAEFVAALNHRPEIARPIDRSREATRIERQLDAEGF
jgi:hypothetical protein